MPLFDNLEQRFKNCIVKNLNCSNPLVSTVSKIVLSNPMSDTGCYYITLLDCNSELVKWKMKQAKLHNTIITLYELIDIRDGAKSVFDSTIMKLCHSL